MKSLREKVVLLTGGSSGIGQATAVECAREGADLVITADKNMEGLNDTYNRVKTLGRECLMVKTDVSEREQVESLCRAAINEFGRVDVLVNNAAVVIFSKYKDVELSDWERIIAVNLWGSIYTIHYLLPHMIERGSGHIVNVSSWTGLLGAPTSGPYATIKFGLVGLSEVLRAELKDYGIGVTAVCPGLILTNAVKTGIIRGFDIAGMAEKSKVFFNTSENVAKKIVKGVKKNQPMVLTDFARLAYQVKRVSPALGRGLSRLWLKITEKAREG